MPNANGRGPKYGVPMQCGRGRRRDAQGVDGVKGEGKNIQGMQDILELKGEKKAFRPLTQYLDA
jgi:hypothetical protein